MSPSVKQPRGNSNSPPAPFQSFRQTSFPSSFLQTETHAYAHTHIKIRDTHIQQTTFLLKIVTNLQIAEKISETPLAVIDCTNLSLINECRDAVGGGEDVHVDAKRNQRRQH